MHIIPSSPRWSGIETRSRGLICGPATLVSATPAAARLWIAKNRRSLAKAEFVPDALQLIPWAEQTAHWKVVVASRESGEVLWQRPFLNHQEAMVCYLRAINFDFEWNEGRTLRVPGEWVEGELHIKIATVATYNSSNSTAADWPTGNKAPAGVTSTDYLVVAGGGAGGTNAGGGGGAGGMKTATGYSVTPGNAYTITVGAGGTQPGVVNTTGGSGGNSVFDVNTSTGGGGGAGGSAVAANGGSGGGGGFSTTAGGTGTGGQGNNGGTGNGGSVLGGGGGGGAGAVGGNASGTTTQTGNGGNGSASSISGSSVTYAGGGGAGDSGSTTGGGTGGTGGGGHGGTTATNANLTAGTTNLGGGGGGGGTGAVNATSANGGSGVVILSFTAANSVVTVNLPMLGM